MQGAHFKTLREAMGMTSDWIANQISVNVRTVKRWEAGRPVPEVPKDVELWILEYWNIYADRVEQVMSELDELQRDHGRPKTVNLSRYRYDEQARRAGETIMTAQMHAALLGHIAMACEQAGYKIDITYREEEN